MSYPRLPVKYSGKAATLEPSRMNRGRWNVWIAGDRRPADTVPGDFAAVLYPEHRATIDTFDRFR